MPRAEQALRMRALRRHVFQHDVDRWARSFLDDLAEGPSNEPRPQNRAGAPPLDVAQRAREAPRLVLILDYDGTLVSLQPLPELAEPDPELLELLRDLASRPNTRVSLASGRRREDMEGWFGDCRWTCTPNTASARACRAAAGPRCRCRRPSGSRCSAPSSTRPRSARPSAFVEEKEVSLAWHYRAVDFDLARDRLRELGARLAEPLGAPDDLEAIRGAKVLEVRPRGAAQGPGGGPCAVAYSGGYGRGRHRRRPHGRGPVRGAAAERAVDSRRRWHEPRLVSLAGPCRGATLPAVVPQVSKARG